MRVPRVKERLEQALRDFARADGYLLSEDLSERCIAARLALHLQRRFRTWKVDVEYNREGVAPKRLPLPVGIADVINVDGRALVVPDIVIHRRGPDGPNLLCLEIKKSRSARGTESDRERVKALRQQLGYLYGAVLVCHVGHGVKPKVEVRAWVDDSPLMEWAGL